MADGAPPPADGMDMDLAMALALSMQDQFGPSAGGAAAAAASPAAASSPTGAAASPLPSPATSAGNLSASSMADSLAAAMASFGASPQEKPRKRQQLSRLSVAPESIGGVAAAFGLDAAHTNEAELNAAIKGRLYDRSDPSSAVGLRWLAAVWQGAAGSAEARGLALFYAVEVMLRREEYDPPDLYSTPADAEPELASALPQLSDEFVDAALSLADDSTADDLLSPVLDSLLRTSAQAGVADKLAELSGAHQTLARLLSIAPVCTCLQRKLELECSLSQVTEAAELQRQSVARVWSSDVVTQRRGRDAPAIPPELLTEPGRGNRDIDSLKDMVRTVQEQQFAVVNTFVRSGTDNRDTMVRWLACLLEAGARAFGAELGNAGPSFGPECFTPALSVNLARTLMQLCVPITKSAKAHQGFKRFDLAWFASGKLGSVSSEPTLAKPRGSEAGGAVIDQELARAILESQGGGAETAQFHFVGEVNILLLLLLLLLLLFLTAALLLIYQVYFLALRSLRVCLVPAFARLDGLQRQYHQMRQQGRPQNELERVAVAYNALECVIHADSLLSTVLQVCALTASWLTSLLAQPEQLAAVPEFIVADLAAGLKHIAQWNPGLLAEAAQLKELVHALIQLVGHASVKGPIVRLHIMQVLKEMLRDTGGRGPAWHMQAFTGAILENKETLLQGAQRLYVDLAYVEGASVGGGGEIFDKNGARNDVADSLKIVWENLSTDPQAGAFDPAEAFADALVEDLVFVFQDALNRLSDVKAMQDEKVDADIWDAQEPSLKKEREAHFESVQSTAKGFLRLAKESMGLLKLLSEKPEWAAVFLRDGDRARKAATVCIDFLQKLVGSKSGALKVAGLGLEQDAQPGAAAAALPSCALPSLRPIIQISGFSTLIVADMPRWSFLQKRKTCHDWCE